MSLRYLTKTVFKPKPRSDSGFTLIEMMVVVTLIALMSSAIMLSVAGQSTRSEQAEIDRFKQHIEQTWLWSELNHQTTRIRFSESSYLIQNWSQGNWRESSFFNTSGDHDLSEELVIEPVSELFNDEYLLFFAGGEYTEFEIEVIAKEKIYALIGDGINAPTLETRPK